MNAPELITAQHRAREAIIYVRQSTPHQVLTNQESLELQYALQQRAIDLGWGTDTISVIDTDLGITGTSIEKREGFKELVTKVTLGKVGIILSYDVTRLSRNCSDWYPLLDICGYKQCLIADRESIYDPSTLNGRLLLGLKGQLAEMELSTIKARLTAGLLNKAQRGDLALSLPTGFIRAVNGVVNKDPNLEVQNRIKLIFETFLEKQSVAKVLKYFHDHNLTIPRYDRFKDVQWKRPTRTSITLILKNPAYAGAFAYGRSSSLHHKQHSADKTRTRLPLEKWKIVVKDKHDGYIDWKTFEKIQRTLKDNHAEYDRNKTRGIARPGAALLQGIIYCGECGHKMVVQYKNGNRYICNHLHRHYAASVCQLLPADALDHKVVFQFFQAIDPIELDVYTQTLKSQSQAHQALHKAHMQQLERLKYQAQLAERQFNQVDPDNRLVAAELEKRWEVALRELKHAQTTLQNQSHTEVPTSQLPEELKAVFLDIGKKLPEIWNSPILSRQQQKSFLRCLIDKVIAHRIRRDCVQVRIVWRGGETTTFPVPISVRSFSELTTAHEMEQSIIRLSKAGKTDSEIACYLQQQGHHSPSKSNSVLESTVSTIRLKNNILKEKYQAHPLIVPGYLTVPQIAKILGVTTYWVYDRIHNGKIIKPQKSSSDARAKYLFEDTPETIKLLTDLKNDEFQNPNFS